MHPKVVNLSYPATQSITALRGIVANAGVIERNYIFNKTFGIKVTNAIVQNNTIISNGIFVEGSYSPKIVNNNINSGNMPSIRLDNTANNINVEYNWWGTTDTSVIDKSIYDFNDDFNFEKVNYTPFLTEPNPYAMPDPNALIPKPNESPPQSPSPSPSLSPSPNSSPTTDQNNNQSTSLSGLNGV